MLLVILDQTQAIADNEQESAQLLGNNFKSTDMAATF